MSIIMNSARGQRQKIAEDTVNICLAGEYAYGDQKVPVDILPSVYYPTDENVDLPEDHPWPAEFEVVDATTLDAAYPYRDGTLGTICLLNFASAKNPGGGFLRGSQAQEEALARASALYWTLKDQDEFYKLSRARDARSVYTDAVIYSPAVAIFKNEHAELLHEPWHADVITCAAPNFGALQKYKWAGNIQEVFAVRLDRMLTVAARHRPNLLVLGAWGCGVFRNDPQMVSELFHKALTGKFQGYFRKVVFGIPLDARNREPFEERFS